MTIHSWYNGVILWSIQCCQMSGSTHCGTASSGNTSTIQHHFWSCDRCTSHRKLYKVCRFVASRVSTPPSWYQVSVSRYSSVQEILHCYETYMIIITVQNTEPLHTLTTYYPTIHFLIYLILSSSLHLGVFPCGSTYNSCIPIYWHGLLTSISFIQLLSKEYAQQSCTFLLLNLRSTLSNNFYIKEW